MATFSQRAGLVPMQKIVQLRAIDGDLRNALWNVIAVGVFERYKPNDYRFESETSRIGDLLDRIFLGLYKMAIDRLPVYREAQYGQTIAREYLRHIVMNGEWNQVYDLIDFISKEIHSKYRPGVVEAFNFAFERENAAYRIVDKELVEITEKIEIEAIESAISSGSRDSKMHLERALQLLSDRKAPDYRNSIKESISAVESVCKAIIGNPGATLGDALKLLKKSKTVHGQFEQALIKLYAYTNDAGGIRHALTESSVEVSSADARLMLVTCSGFCSYLWALSANAPTNPTS